MTNEGLGGLGGVSEPATKTTARSTAEESLLDAAERLLVDVGYARITTRRLAEEAGVNHGLVHYYFGSNESLLVRALERFTERMIERQRELYAADVPSWRSGAPRCASSSPRTGRTRRCGSSCRRWPGTTQGCASGSRASTRSGATVLTDAFREPHRGLGIEMPLEALVSLVITFNVGIMVERLGGIDAGHPSSWHGSTDGCRADHAGAEQSRARCPDEVGYVVRDGVRVFYEVYGTGGPTFLLLPTWSIIHSRQWKAQIPFLARERVVTFDGRGNGRSDRPTESEAYDEREFALDAVAVLDATATDRAVVVGYSLGAPRGLILAAEQPDRVAGAVFIGPAYSGGGEPLPER